MSQSKSDQRPTLAPRLSSGLMAKAKSASAGAFKLAEAALLTPPTTPDGLTAAEARAPSDTPTSPGFIAGLWDQAQKHRLGADVATTIQAVTSSMSVLDDRELLIENAVTMLANLPDNSSLQSKLTGQLINQLWEDLSHPPPMFLAQGRFREADGSGNNPAYPSLGAAGTPYARSVPKMHPSPNNLPDPTIVFDALLKRDGFTPHPSGISSLLFSFATLIIHSAFETNQKDPHINDTSSYLDLSPLYGNSQAEQDTVRSKEHGRLYPDVVASRRIMFMPPPVFALLISFSRHHNFIAEKLAAINEGGRFSAIPNRKPEENDPNYDVAFAAWQNDPDGKIKQDEELFQTARLINCGFFANVIFMDYIRVILNVNKTESLWSLTPTNEVHNAFGPGLTERGTGNACSVEFNILYRWHAAVSAKDEKWLVDFMFAQFQKPMDEVSPMEFGMKLKSLSAEYSDDRRTWTHGDLVRNADGSFNDGDLVKILSEATDEVAGAFGARKTPAVMKLIDVLGMATARNKWNTCSLNEFRKFLNLKPFTTFEEWNSDKDVARVAEQLYVHPDNLELFVGLQAEEAKPSRDGSGLAPGYTVSRAILSDAVALVRGDRFFTVDNNSATLTNWGFQDVTPDPAGGSYGGVIGKILMRAFPTSYTFNSIYALFPFSTPAVTRSSLESFGKLDKYDFTHPTKRTHEIKSVRTYAAMQQVLLDTKRFGVYYSAGIEELVKDHRPFFIGTDNERIHMRDRAVMSNALFNPGWQDRLKSFYTSMTAKLIKDKSWSYDGGKTMNLDVVRDVTNMTAVHWVSWQFGIPLKTETTPHAFFTPKELYGILSAFFCYVFMNFDNVPGFKLREAATSHAPLMQAIIETRLAQTNGTPAILDGLAHGLQKLVFGDEVQGVVMGTEATAFYRRILKNSDRPLSELNSSIQCTMTASVSNQGEALAHVLNLYLDPKNAKHYKELVRLSNEDGEDADNDIRAYIYEALRLDPQVPFIPRVCKEDAVIVDGDREVHVRAGDHMYPSIKNSGQDQSVYPNPEEIDITRDRSNTKFRGFGYGMHECLGARICHYTLVAQVREVFKLKNVRRAPGPAGKLQRIMQELAETECPVYITAQGTLSPLPQSLAIVYDSDI